MNDDLSDLWIARYTDEGGVHRTLYQSDEEFLGIVARYSLPEEQRAMPAKNRLTVELAWLNTPAGDGNYVLTIFDCFRRSEPMLAKRFRASADAEKELVQRFGELDALCAPLTDEAWDGCGKYFDYDLDQFVVRIT